MVHRLLPQVYVEQLLDESDCVVVFARHEGELNAQVEGFGLSPDTHNGLVGSNDNLIDLCSVLAVMLGMVLEQIQHILDGFFMVACDSDCPCLEQEGEFFGAGENNELLSIKVPLPDITWLLHDLGDVAQIKDIDITILKEVNHHRSACISVDTGDIVVDCQPMTERKENRRHKHDVQVLHQCRNITQLELLRPGADFEEHRPIK